MAKKKWYISGIRLNSSFFTEGKRVLRQRLHQVLTNAENYLNSHSIEDLHQLRISIRRLRYPMEIFVNFFSKQIFNNFYDKINKLQDLTGCGRDADVMIMKLASYNEQKIATIQSELFDFLKTQKDDQYNSIDKIVHDFLADPILGEVKEVIEYNRFVKHR